MDYNLSRSYRTQIRRSLDEDRAQIAAIFAGALRGGAQVGVRLVNYYKGLPINYPATVFETGQGVVDLDVHQQQAVAMSATRYTFIKCDLFDCALLAEVQNVNVRKMTASLRNFVFVEIMAEQRSAIRIELDPPTEAEIQGSGFTMTGKVLDMSLGGVSIAVEEQAALPPGSEVVLRLKVPNLLQDTVNLVEAKGRLVATSREDGVDICCFAVSADAQSEGVISRFLFQRQVEIIRELKEQS